MSKHHHSHRTRKEKIKDYIKKYGKYFVLILLFLLAITSVFLDSKKGNYTDVEENNIKVQEENNYDGLITIVDGEGYDTFSSVWGQLIKDGYPICSNLIVNYVGKEGYMDWDTIEALNDLGVDFIFHSTNHKAYASMSYDEVLFDFEYGKEKMKEHGLNDRYIVWIGLTNPSIIEMGNNYFEGGFAINNSNIDYDQINGRKPIIYYYKEQGYSYPELQSYIDYAIKNNEWIVLFTKSNYDFMNEDQINTFRKAFEYATEHNVGIVTASEGFDLYYSNKLGNN